MLKFWFSVFVVVAAAVFYLADVVAAVSPVLSFVDAVIASASASAVVLFFVAVVVPAIVLFVLVPSAVVDNFVRFLRIGWCQFNNIHFITFLCQSRLSFGIFGDGVFLFLF